MIVSLHNFHPENDDKLQPTMDDVRWPWRSRVTPVAITYHSSILSSYRRHVTAVRNEFVRNADVCTVQSPYCRHSSTHANNTTMYQS